jgi:hypothetical protein
MTRAGTYHRSSDRFASSSRSPFLPRERVNSMTHPSALPRPARRLAAAALVIMSTLTVIGITAGPASAQPGPTQTGGHIVAGSRLGVRDGMCSAGLVVKNDARLSNLSAYNRATRYVVTAAHCFDRGSDDVSYGGEVVGQAVWKDAASDLALVKVAPIVHNNQACAPSSGVFHCVGSVTYEPRALGRVILASLRTRSIDKLPVVATGAPPAVGVFCASGAWTGPDCSLSSARSTPNMGLREGERLAVSRGAQFVSRRLRRHHLLPEWRRLRNHDPFRKQCEQQLHRLDADQRVLRTRTG